MRRRRRSTFSSSPDGLGRVRWLQPARTRRTAADAARAAPAAGRPVAGAAGAGWVLLAREAAADRRQEAVERFAAAWERGDYPAMWRAISPSAAGTGPWPSSPPATGSPPSRRR